MKSKITLAYVFLAVGVLNFAFLVDTLMTDPTIEFSIFSITTTRTINIIYYGVICFILFLTGINMIRTNKKSIK